MIRSLWLAKRGDNSVALRMIPRQREKCVDFEVLQNVKPSAVEEGTARRGSATCPGCNYTTPAANVRRQFEGRHGGTGDAQLLVVATTHAGIAGKRYRSANHRDISIFERAIEELSLVSKQEPNVIPQEPLPYLRSIFNIHLLDVQHWCDLFNPRQMLSLVKLFRIIADVGNRIGSTIPDPELVTATTTCLALAVDRVAAQYSSLSWWHPSGEFVVGTFGRQALGIIWDFAEIRPVAGASGDLDGAIDWIVRVVETLVDPKIHSGSSAIASATHHPLPNDSATAIVTDPPYYDAVPYADLSDFFYVLLKRMLKKQHAALFMEQLTPKHGEIVQLAERNKDYAFKTKEYFETGMKNALAEARRVLTPSGICVVVFAHKTTDGWEAQLQATINAGWTITGSWPIDTERSVRMRAKDSAVLASSIHLVCRPRENADGTLAENIGDWRDVLRELPLRIHEWMPRLAAEGVVGADAIFACLGPALEIFSRYSRVEKASGEQVTLGEYLEHVWAAVAREALSLLFKDADASGLEPDARLTAMWLWTLSTADDRRPTTNDGSDEGGDDEEEGANSKGGSKGGFSLEFDAARKIAQGLGANLDILRHVVEVKGEMARLLGVGERTHYLFGKDEGQAPSSRRTTTSAQQMSMFNELEQADHDAG